MRKTSAQMRRMWKRFLALVLTAVMPLSTMSDALAAQSDSEIKGDNSAVSEMIKKGSVSYPNGAFGLLNTQINMTEGDEEQKITIV